MGHVQDPSVPAIYLAHFVDAVVAEPRQYRAMLAAAGLSAERAHPTQRVAIEQVLALIAALDAQAARGWHIEPALALEAAHHGPVGIAVSSAPTLGRSLELLARFEPLRINFAALHCRLAGDRWSGRIIPMLEPEGPWDLLLEIHLLSLAGLLGRLLGGGRAAVLELRMPERYRPWRSALEQRFSGRVQFAGHHYQLDLPATALSLPSLLASADLHDDAVGRCEQLLARQSRTSPLAAQIQSRLLAAEGDWPGLEDMARQLCCSSRTLSRRLGEAGTSYRQICDEVRRLLALDLLRRSSQSIDAIAIRLGYHDTANFSRACRRWFGVSPGKLRRTPADVFRH